MTETDQSRDETVDAPTGLPVLPPLAALIEIVVLVIGPGLLDYFVPGFPALNETQPHFYWLPVLLLTLQYGSASGLLAAGVAIVLANLLGWPEQEIGENHFGYLLRIWLQPVLWIATAVILGQIRLRQIERKQVLGRSVALLTRQRAALAEHAQNLRARCDRLERFIATRHEADGLALMCALGRTQTASAADAAEALHEAVTLAFGDCRLAVLARDGNELRNIFQHGAASEPEPRPILAESAFYQAVIRDQASLSVLSPAAQQALEGRGIAAVPIVHRGDIDGAVLLQACNPGLLDISTPDRLKAIGLAASNLQQDNSVQTAARRPQLAGPHSDEPQAGTLRLASWRRVRRQINRLVGDRSGRKA